MFEYLHKKLERLEESGPYPFHMPGHKRADSWRDMEINAYAMDITEIDGFDDLNHPVGLLKEHMEKAAQMYGSDHTFFSVNGSTAALLSAIFAVTTTKGEILVARNCHKSIYNAILLRELTPYYIYPQIDSISGISGGIYPQNVTDLLKTYGKVQAIVITSPTYEGIVSDIESIAQIAHKNHLPLIVDEAHGAHFSFTGDDFPQSALRAGADVVVQSLHKTLPSLTQTAVVHVQGELVDGQRIARYLRMFSSSSPSYVLMSSMTRCLELMETDGAALMQQYSLRLKQLRGAIEDLDFICLFNETQAKKIGFAYDIGKIMVYVKDNRIDGGELYHRLRTLYNLQPEMYTEQYVLLMTSVCDTQEGFDRLLAALKEIDSSLSAAGKETVSSHVLWDAKGGDFLGQPFIMSPALAEKEESCGNKECICLEQAAGRVAADFIYQYPPGIPLIVPGEAFTHELICQMKNALLSGVKLEGVCEGKSIWVLKVRDD